MDGDIIWMLDFLLVVETEGYMDCSYIMIYSGYEDCFMFWLCLDCSIIVCVIG